MGVEPFEPGVQIAAIFRLDRMDDGTIGVLPVLRERPAPFDVGAAYREWEEAGRPLPPEDEARRIQRSEDTLAEGMWVTGDERIRPPAKALSVVDRNLTYSHGYGRFLSISLPPLEVTVGA